MSKFKPLVSDKTLQRVYSRMLEARALDTRLKSLRRMKNLTTGGGIEATLAAMLDDLRPTDLMIARKVDPQAHLLRGRTVAAILGDLMATDAPASRALFAPSDDGISLFTGTPGEMATFAAGSARGLQNEAAGKRGKQSVTMAILGEVKDVNSLDSALRAAGQGHLPLILVCFTHGSDRLKVSRDSVHGVPHMPVDGRDALAVYRVAQESLLRVRTGLGSVLVECRLFPGDPITLIEERLTRKALFDIKMRDDVIKRFERSLDSAFRASKFLS